MMEEKKKERRIDTQDIVKLVLFGVLFVGGAVGAVFGLPYAAGRFGWW